MSMASLTFRRRPQLVDGINALGSALRIVVVVAVVDVVVVDDVDLRHMRCDGTAGGLCVATSQPTNVSQRVAEHHTKAGIRFDTSGT